MSLPSLLNVPRNANDWQHWSFSNAQDHLKILQAIQQQTGNITGVTLTNGGTGYTSIPSIILDSNGSGASFSITITGGVITSVSVQSQGHGYQSNFFQFSGGGGTGATATITIRPVIKLIQYQLDPINFDDPTAFLKRHAETHTDMNSALGLQSIDLEETDLKDPNKLQAWIYSNYQEHNNAHVALGI